MLNTSWIGNKEFLAVVPDTEQLVEDLSELDSSKLSKKARQLVNRILDNFDFVEVGFQNERFVITDEDVYQGYTRYDSNSSEPLLTKPFGL